MSCCFGQIKEDDFPNFDQQTGRPDLDYWPYTTDGAMNEFYCNVGQLETGIESTMFHDMMGNLIIGDLSLPCKVTLERPIWE